MFPTCLKLFVIVDTLTVNFAIVMVVDRKRRLFLAFVIGVLLQHL